MLLAKRLKGAAPVAEVRLRSLDLFAGAGGLTAGMQQVPGLALDTVRAVESDPAAAATFEANHGAGTACARDIEHWLADEDVPEVDLIIGGPPCQGFSSLNRNGVGRDRNNGMWAHYAETVRKARPRWFVLENVTNFLRSPELAEFEAMTTPGGMLREWRIEKRVLHAADFGAPQSRKRAVVIGTHRDEVQPHWPVPIRGEGSYETVQQAWLGLPSEVTDISLPDRVTVFRGREYPGRFFGHELHVTRQYTELSLRRFAVIPPGGNRFDLPPELQAPCWRRHTSGAGDVMGRLRANRPSVTIRTEFFKPEKGRYLHPTVNRAITHLEAARLQGFPDDYRWVGNKTEIARQIGNAVPLSLASALGRVIAAAASGSRSVA